jgi:hypothetical protein
MKRGVILIAIISLFLVPAAVQATPPEDIGTPHTVPVDADKLDGYHASDLIAMISDLQGVIKGLQKQVNSLESQLADLAPLKDLADFVYVDYETRNSLAGPHIIFHGANVHVQNGTEYPYSINGLGNLIIGYNECRGKGGPQPPTEICGYIEEGRDASHILVVGDSHEYSSMGGLVAGSRNTVTGEDASVTGGISNRAAGPYSIVSGGNVNVAIGESSSISGGTSNRTNGDLGWIGGGQLNRANGLRSSVSGGEQNEANGDYSSVSGGQYNQANHSYSTVSGGRGIITYRDYDHRP